MAKIPNFAGAEKLSLTDLQALADAVAGQERVLPPAPLSGRIGSRKYSLANFNLKTANSCDGSAWPENEGLIRSVAYTVEDEPYICQGDIAIPMAHYVPGADAESPAAIGVLHSVLVEGGITAPDIQRGQMRLPLADSACDSAVAGLIQSVQVDEDASAPYISQGTLYLLPSGGGGSDITEVLYTSYVSSPVIESGTIKHPYAQTDLEGSSVAGVMSGRIMSSNVMAPTIENGDIVLPWAQMNLEGSSVMGMVIGIEYNSAIEAPSISDGLIQIPSGSETITEVVYTSYVSSPVIESGTIKHPYAQTDLEGSSSVAGVLSGQISVSQVSSPYIENGNMILPYAQYENGSSVTGLIAGVMTSAVSAPIIQDGKLILPQSGGTVLGLRDMYGNPIAWADLYTSGAQQTSLAQFTAGGTTLTLCANFSDGYLNFEFRT